MAGPRAWAALLSWFHFSLVCRPWPEAGSGPVGLEGTELVLLLPTCTQAIVVSVLARGRTGVKVAPGPPSACTVAALPSLSCVLTLCNSVDCSTPGFPVLRHLPEFAQTHITSIELMMSSNHLILCCPLLPSSILPSIKVF